MPTWCPRIVDIEQANGVVQRARAEVHVPERHRERRVAEELLDGLRRRTAARKFARVCVAERVPADLRDPGGAACATETLLGAGVANAAALGEKHGRAHSSSLSAATSLAARAELSSGTRMPRLTPLARQARVLRSSSR